VSVLEEPDVGRELDGLTVGQWSLLERLGRSLHLRGADLQATLAAITETAIAVVPAAELASVNLLVDGRFEPRYVSGEAARLLDAEQLRLGDGPCIRSSATQGVILVGETADEPRWQEYCDLAFSLGVRSMLCLPLAVDEVNLGSLTLYAPAPVAFTDYDERVAALCATHAALALSSAQQVENLRVGLVNRDTIGMAKGILMASLKVTPDQAFSLLVDRSQRSGRKVADVAGRVVETGGLDGDETAPQA
jgi:GAF domain-containing protein